MTNSVSLIWNHSWIVLQLWCWLPTQVHISPCISSWKTDCTKPGTVFLFSTLVDSSTWITPHSDSLILSNNCASISSAVSSICLVTVLDERGTHATFWTAASPKVHDKWTLAADRINSSPIVKDFLPLAMKLALRMMLSADTFDEVVAFSNCFCSSYSLSFFPPLKNSRDLHFIAGCLVFLW